MLRVNMRSIYSSVWRSEIQFRSDFCYSLANITYTKTEHLHNETAQTIHQKAPYKADAFWDAARRFGHSIYEQAFVHGGCDRSQRAGKIPSWGQTPGGAAKKAETNGGTCKQECRRQVRRLTHTCRKPPLKKKNTGHFCQYHLVKCSLIALLLLKLDCCIEWYRKKVKYSQHSIVQYIYTCFADSDDFNWLPWSY